MKRLSFVALALFSFTFAAFAADSKVLKVGSTGQSFPNGFKQDGKLVGFDVEVTEAIAKKLGYKIEWVNTEFAGLVGQLDAKRLDTIANVFSITPARQEKYLYSQPYSYYGSQLVTHVDYKDIKTIKDLYGKQVAGVLGSQHLNNLRIAFPNGEAKIITYETRGEAMKQLELKRVQGYVNSRPILLAEIKQRNLPFKLVGDALVNEAVGYPFSKDAKGEKLQKEFNKALTELKKEGVIAKLAIKYFGEDISK
ncbi:amino acid ABC transporter substrate-binding protein [Deferribacterales bacterium RsTz2092]|nr:putative amino-acid-binding protein YxeM [Deferribacterales bacterium]